MDATEGATLIDSARYLAALLPIGGGALQWMRANRSIPDSRTFVWAAVIALGVYLLCMDWTALPSGVGAIQKSLLDGLVWLGTVGMTSVLGGTFTASKLASATDGRIGIPVTNSKP